jgi:8-oxo-dGTP pyrophosphatase MutT (NUDIX family)
MSNHATLPLWSDADDIHKLTILKGQIEDLYRFTLSKYVAEVLKTLEDSSPADEKEARDIKLISEMCRTYPNIFSAHCEVGHITGSALIIEPISKNLLLHYHLAAGKWLQFGGHADSETVPWQIAYREAIEETNLSDIEFFPSVQDPKPLDIDAQIIAEQGGQPSHYHLDFRYLFLTKHPELATMSSESKEFKWVNIDDIDSMDLDHALRRLILKAKRGLYG